MKILEIFIFLIFFTLVIANEDFNTNVVGTTLITELSENNEP